MGEDLGQGTMTGEHEKPEFDSTNTKIHGEPPAISSPGQSAASTIIDKVAQPSSGKTSKCRIRD